MLDLAGRVCGVVPLCDQLFPASSASSSYFSVALPFQLFWYGLVIGTLIGCMGSTLLKYFVLPMFLTQIALAAAAGFILWHI